MTIEFTAEDKLTFKNLGVSALILFGSQAEDRARPLSDFDIGVITENASLVFQEEKRKEIYDALYDILSSRINKLINIDIVFLETAPHELKAHVMKRGRVLFETKPGVFADFKERTMLMYADFAPLREIFHKAILQRI